jgi:hypothetical protein
LNIIFNNGTTRQHEWFIEAMAHSLFPWSRFDQVVRVEWAPRAEFPVGRLHHAFAITTWTPDPTDACGRPNQALVTILDDLDDPKRPGNENGWPVGYYAGKEFYMETVHHELGHVAQMKFTEEQKNRLTLAVYNGHAPGDWDSQSLQWWEQRQESDAETFKDVWLPKPYRKFNNRTKHRMPLSAFDTYMSVLDEICPCKSSGACFEQQVLYQQRSGGDIGFSLVWLQPQEENNDINGLGPGHGSIATWPPLTEYRWYEFRVRYGGIGYQLDAQSFNIPNPYWSPTESPLDTFSVEVFDLADDIKAWRFIGTNGAPTPEAVRFYWDPRAPSPVPHQVGFWRLVNNFEPVTQDNVTGSGFVPEWWLASLKYCDPLIIR